MVKFVHVPLGAVETEPRPVERVSHRLTSSRMEDKVQQPASDEPKQVTPKGYEIPVPKRRDLMDAFRKIIQPKKP